MNLKAFGKYLHRKSIARRLHQARKDSYERMLAPPDTSRTFRRRPASSLNSRVNFRRSMAHLRFHQYT